MAETARENQVSSAAVKYETVADMGSGLVIAKVKLTDFREQDINARIMKTEMQKQRLVREIGDAVANAVAAMNQTYVNDLKAAGTFNEAEQKEALMRAVSAALKSMSRDAQDYIKSNFGDTTQYLENRIEAQIDANHVAAKQAAVQNTLNLG